MKTTTTTGVAVELTPVAGLTGRKDAGVQMRMTHPKLGALDLFSRNWAVKQGVGGAEAFGMVGGKYQTICVSVPKEAFDAVMVEAKRLTVLADAEEQRLDDEARDACPAGFVACRLISSSGDSCMARYRTTEGVEVVTSDLARFENRRGWFYLPADLVAEETEKRAAAQARKDQAEETTRQRVEKKEAAALAKAKETGEEVVIASWVEEGEGDFVYCSRVATPDGKVEYRELGR